MNRPTNQIDLTRIDRIEDLERLVPEWESLARQGGDGALFRGPGWALAWFRAYRSALGAELHVLVGRDGEDVIGLAPFYARTARMGPAVKCREIRLLGDAGPRPPAFDVLALAGHEERFAQAVAAWLTAEGASWDVLDLQPLRDPSRTRAYLAQRLDSTGCKVDSHEASTTLSVALAGQVVSVEGLGEDEAGLRVYVDDPAALEKGLAALRRLSRLEWAAREEASPIAETEATQLLHDLVLELGPRGQARLARLDDARGEATAAALVVDDPPRAACVALAVDPEGPGAARLLSAEARAAAGRGLKALDIVMGAVEVEPPPLPVSVKKSLRLRAFNNTAAGKVARTYASLKRRAEIAREAPGTAAATARAAWSKIREAAANVAAYERLHLYRGELWVRGIAPPPGLEVKEITLEDFDKLTEVDRADLVQRLELDEAYCREKWSRGDLVIVARLHDRPAGIAWCARTPVFVPEIGREVRPGPSECYIHDVFVAPPARGRNVAPVMLESLARRLRQRDVYRAWALIEPSNVASIRAFEKAAYASVADVVYARMGVVDRITLRPPDPEGKKILGVT